jgi:hypothetical protein
MQEIFSISFVIAVISCETKSVSHEFFALPLVKRASFLMKQVLLLMKQSSKNELCLSKEQVMTFISHVIFSISFMFSSVFGLFATGKSVSEIRNT